MNNAASGGHTAVLEYLASNLDEGCTEYAMIMSAWHGHLDIVKWLHNNRAEVSVFRSVSVVAVRCICGIELGFESSV